MLPSYPTTGNTDRSLIISLMHFPDAGTTTPVSSTMLTRCWNHNFVFSNFFRPATNHRLNFLSLLTYRSIFAFVASFFRRLIVFLFLIILHLDVTRGICQRRKMVAVENNLSRCFHRRVALRFWHSLRMSGKYFWKNRPRGGVLISGVSYFCLWDPEQKHVE